MELTANGTQVPLTEETSGELTGTAPATQPADLAPGRSATTDLVITIRTERGRPARAGRITVTSELLAQGFTPLQPTCPRTGPRTHRMTTPGTKRRGTRQSLVPRAGGPGLWARSADRALSAGPTVGAGGLHGPRRPCGGCGLHWRGR